MPKKWCSLLLGLFVLSLASVTSSTSSNELFTSSFLVRFKRSVDNSVAHEIAKRNSFYNIGPVSGFMSCFYILRVVYLIVRWLPSIHPTLITLFAQFNEFLMAGKAYSDFKFIEIDVDFETDNKGSIISAFAFKHMESFNELNLLVSRNFGGNVRLMMR